MNRNIVYLMILTVLIAALAPTAGAAVETQGRLAGQQPARRAQVSHTSAIGAAGSAVARPVAQAAVQSPNEAASARPPADVPGNWWAQVQEDIRRSEYEVTWQDSTYLADVLAAYQAPNRAHNLRTYFTTGGIRVIPRQTTGAPDWEWGLTLMGYGDAAGLTVSGNRVEYHRGTLTEWYINDERGLEQGFTLLSPLLAGEGSGERSVVLDLALSGNLTPHLVEGGQAVEFTTPGGVRVLRYSDLRAYDATGRTLPAGMFLDVSRFTFHVIRLTVDTTGATYPITIDPLSTTPRWSAESDQADALFGYSVGTAGDVNADGYADAIIGARHYDNGQSDEGRAYVYHGSASGLSTTANWIAESDSAGASFGMSVGTAGDVNGDGYSDVIVGAGGYNGGLAAEGRAYVYHGSAAGLSTTANWSVESNLNQANFGYSVGTAGDINGDGFSDIIVGAWGYNNGEGGAFVYHGSPSGLNTTADWSAQGNQAGARFGFSVGTAGDVNGDSFADVIIGAYTYGGGGRVFVYHGSLSGLATTANWYVDGSGGFGRSVGTAGDVNGDGYSDVIVGAPFYNNSTGQVTVYHGSASGLATTANWTPFCLGGSQCGESVGTAGDVNGDGHAEVLVGAPGNSGVSHAYGYYGSASGLSPVYNWLVTKNQGGTTHISVGTAGDVNGDGYSDVMIGLAYYDNGQTDEGRAYLFNGSSSGLSGSANWMAEGDNFSAYFGFSVGSAGDVNGDGYSDVISGAPGYDNGEYGEGRAFIYHGAVSGLSPTPNWTAESNQSNAEFGTSVATAGDVNGDGYSDVIIGAPGYDNGETNEGRVYVFYSSPSAMSTTPDWSAEGNQADANFGIAVGTAGDVNGDGYADLAIGANLYDSGQTDEGRAYVYYGAAAGLPASANWTREGNQAGAGYGVSVGTAGDVNGDGYADLIVGADFYDNGQLDEGRAFVYYGAASGLATTASWTAESDLAGAHFGVSVGTAGDVNGDGYSDVIVGAPDYNDGQAFVYHGSSSGLSAIANWTATDDNVVGRFGIAVGSAGDVNGDGYADVIVGSYSGSYDGAAFLYHGSASGLSMISNWIEKARGSNPNEQFGHSVGTAGDVNGDGYADVIVGAPGYENGQSYEGGAFVYYGGALSLSSAAHWTAESDQSGAQLGASVGTAGDVNGDGYADLIIGAPRYDNGQTDEGRAFVYYGSAIGPGFVANWTAESNQANAYFGQSAGTAGDVNGDGYSDVIVGAYLYDGGQTDEGRAYVYYGGATGLSASAAWTAESNQANAQFGFSVGAAGDVDANGYADIIVGAPGYTNGQPGEGRVYLFYGYYIGLSTNAIWTAESDQVGAGLGISVGTAGDVNRDGYSDVIVGAWSYDNGQTDEGRAYVYHGSPSIPGATANWTAESDQDQAFFGISVGTAGDVNGDGYSDVIVGAYNYDNGETNEGRAFVYHGSTTGLSPIANWTAESNQGGARLGNAVATAGDVNGDGYADVVIATYHYDNAQVEEGRVYVYHGSAGGLAPIANWKAEGNQALSYFGIAVGTAGDVNGDGYADLLVGAYQYDRGQADEGRAFLFYGNGGPGKALNPRQRRNDDAGPVAHLGASDSVRSFRVALRGRTPFGRGLVKLQWEVKPLGEVFYGTGIVESSIWMDTGAAGVELSELVQNLSFNLPYHWRVRLKYHPVTSPFQRYSRWLTMPWNGWNEQDLRTSNCEELAFGDPPYSAAISVPGEVDCYSFPAAAGDWLRVSNDETSGALIADLALFSPFDVVCDPGSIAEFDCQTALSGTHKLFVADQLGTNTGGYNLMVQRLNNPVGCTALAFGDPPVAAAITQTAEMDCYTFFGLAGDRVRVRIIETSGTLGTTQDIRRPDGSGYPYWLDCGDTPNPEMTCLLDTSGTHGIFVRDFWRERTGNYSIYIQRLNNPVGCTALTFGTQPVAGSITAAAEVDCFTVTGAANDRIRVRMVETAGAWSARWEVLRPDGTTRCLPTNITEATCQFDVAGAHTILASDQVGTSTGSYLLRVDRLNNPVGCSPIAFGNPPTSAAITATLDVDCYTFTGAVGDRMRITAIKTSGAMVGVNHELIRPDGSTLCGPTHLPESTCLLDAAGTHAIFLRDQNWISTGTYNIHLQRLNNPVGCTALTFGPPATAASISTAAESDCYLLGGAPGISVRVRLTETVGTLGGVMEVLRPDGTTRCGPTSASLLDCAFDVTGTHTIIARDSARTNTGNYLISLECLSGNCVTLPGPCTLSASKSGNNVVLSWGASAGATGYNVYRGTTPYFTPGTPYATTTALSYTDTGAIGLPNHYYRVGAANASGETLCTNRVGEFTFTLVAGPPGETALNDIGIPLGVSASGITDAESLAVWIETEGGAPFGTVRQLLKWDAFLQNFLAWSHEFGFGDNFAVNTGDFVFLTTDENAPATTTFVGRVPEAGEVFFSLAGGTPTVCALNFITLPFDQAALSTADLLSDDIGIPDQTVVQALDWEASLGNFLAWSNVFGFGDNFPTAVGYPYIVCLSDMGVPPEWP